MFALVACVFPGRDDRPAVNLRNNPEPLLLSQLDMLPEAQQTSNDSSSDDADDSWELGGGPETELPAEEPQLCDPDVDVVALATLGMSCCNCLRSLREGVHVVQWRGQGRSLCTICVNCTPEYASGENILSGLMAALVDFEMRAPDNVTEVVRELADQLWLMNQVAGTDSDMTLSQEENQEPESEPDSGALGELEDVQ